MAIKVRDIMRTDVETVETDLPLAELERAFVEHRMSGFPVVESGRMVGIVSRSDIVRQLCVERTRAEMALDYYRESVEMDTEPRENFEEVAQRVGNRIEHLTTGDVMIRDVLTISPDATLQQVAQLLVKQHIHRVPVTESDQLVGIVSTLDLVRLFADGRARVDQSE